VGKEGGWNAYLWRCCEKPTANNRGLSRRWMGFRRRRLLRVNSRVKSALTFSPTTNRTENMHRFLLVSLRVFGWFAGYVLYP